MFFSYVQGLLAWDVLVCTFVLYTILLGPVDMSWNLCPKNVCWTGVVGAVSDLIFLIDMAVIFRTLLIFQVRGQEVVVTDVSLIAKKYFSTYFIFDLCSIGAPFTIFFEEELSEDAILFRWISAFGLFKVSFFCFLIAYFFIFIFAFIVVNFLFFVRRKCAGCEGSETV